MASSRPILDGVFGIHKPMGMSSAQVIRDCQHHFNPSNFFKPMIDEEKQKRDNESNTRKKRRGFGKRDIQVKMGHGGTLDPLATGVLILGVGKGTKSLQSFLECTKEYETVVLFGASTDSYDRVGRILKKTAYQHITRPMVEEALSSFRGKTQQIPPIFSALKMDGKPLYKYAQEGKALPREIQAREVEVTEIELLEWYEPGQHSYRWPTEQATVFERNFAEEVFKIKEQQATAPKLTPEEKEEETKALKAHEIFKRKADKSVDALVYDQVNHKRQRTSKRNDPPMLMSGALGDPPPALPKPGKGSNLIPESDPNAALPWEGIGPPAAKIRMTVTSGFYVRSFCHDLGMMLNSSAMMAELCRSRQGEFVLGSSNCMEYSDLAKGESVWAPKMKNMLSMWNSKPHDKPSEQAMGAQQDTAKSNGFEGPAEHASAEKSEEAEDSKVPEDDPSSEKLPLPTPKSSSPVPDSKETKDDDAKPDVAEIPATTTSLVSGEATQSETKEVGADEEALEKVSTVA
ncbi:trub family pseudouridylate synthase-containing protein [Annulohypoxylon truncatum]|uniref:trub family pseudouridylate synthase-containing protein n=1 Tax=Annulohypoxylon truncatum TaxID=327061 RepID=UPI002008B14C|nr:trub family pseudouridylate synthase-containing protein [Annulohypoxylon truncatum]KAI1215112.1 trub family pseudouridylate synthase-containing protein [Annulohypoxylon truncatum]